VYLVYLAWKMWHAPDGAKDGPLPSERAPWRLFLAGMTVTLATPKTMVFSLALLPSLIDLRSVGLGGWAALTATMAAVLILIDFSSTLAAAQDRTRANTP